MLPLVAVASVFVAVIGLSAGEPPRFVHLGPGEEGLSLQMSDPTPAHDVALNVDFVPASAGKEERVMKQLDKFARTWGEKSLQISVTAIDLNDAASGFARQLESWLSGVGLVTVNPDLPKPLGEVTRAPDVQGLTILCRAEDRPLARQFALAIAPVVRGQIEIRFSAGMADNQLDIRIEGTPRFADSGVAYFPAVDVDA